MRRLSVRPDRKSGQRYGRQLDYANLDTGCTVGFPKHVDSDVGNLTMTWGQVKRRSRSR